MKDKLIEARKLLDEHNFYIGDKYADGTICIDGYVSKQELEAILLLWDEL